MGRLIKAILADFERSYSPSKVDDMLTMPITWSSGVRGFVLPFVLPALAASLSLIPVEEPAHGFQGWNLNLLWFGLGVATFTAYAYNVRFTRMLPDTQLNSNQRNCCVLAFVMTCVVLITSFWYFFAFPFPFSK